MARVGPCSIALAALCFVTAFAPRSRATETELRGRLAWVLGDADLTRADRTTVPVSEGFGSGDRPGYALFFDALAARDRSRRSRLELELSRQEAFVDARAFAVLALDVDLEALLAPGERAPSDLVEDRGTRLGVSTAGSAGRVLVELYPVDTDGLRLGRLRDLDFGATDTRRGESSFFDVEGGVPGGRVVWQRGWVRAELVGKVARTRSPSDELLFGALARLTVAPGAAFSIDLGGGCVQHPSTLSESGRGFSAVARLRLAAFGARVRALEQRGFPAEAPRSLGPGLGLAVEGVGLVQRLDDAERPSTPRLEPGWAFAVSGAYAAPRVETWMSVWARSPSFVLRYGPGLVPGRSLPRRGRAQSEVSVAILSRLRGLGAVTPELGAGIRIPATFTPAGCCPPAEPLVLHGPGDYAPLVAGRRRLLRFEARLGLVLELSPVKIAPFVLYRRDGSRSALVPDGAFVRVRRFVRPDAIGAGVAVIGEL
ncbi:MAG: hypothetical protein DIU78_022845 [Pseudomonadota bacterium]|nr:MAG: hypothetical protein DIU78_05800 [Pseudomonadota bacterium]